ncbi:hypothetical protein SDC9_173581 [bioreactor metagenome]|uniref:Uncharacterized protein n=1 Tax=bioreactor metagenome TaxID=1076179 RepID=A0A645GGU2_9ZZZZ
MKLHFFGIASADTPLLGPKGGDFQYFAVGKNAHGAESRPYGYSFFKQAFYLFGQGACRNVVIAAFSRKQHIPNAAADKIAFKPSLIQFVEHMQRIGREVGIIHLFVKHGSQIHTVFSLNPFCRKPQCLPAWFLTGRDS